MPVHACAARCSTAGARASASACGVFAGAAPAMYFSSEPPRPTLMRAPGNGAERVAQLAARSTCLLTPPRSPRGVRLSVSVALRTSAAPPRRERVGAGRAAADGGVDAASRARSLATIWRACFGGGVGLLEASRRAAARCRPASASRSSGGMKPVGSSGTSASEPKKKTARRSCVSDAVAQAPADPAHVDRDPARLRRAASSARLSM